MSLNNMETNARQWQKENRHVWSINRSFLEATSFKYKRYGGKRKRYWTSFVRLARIFGYLLRIMNLHERGYRNARNIMVRKTAISFTALPKSFESYRLLHLTDLHLDSINGIAEIICKRLRDIECDLCVLTGDFREQTHGGFKQILAPLQNIVKLINARDGILAVLGNHDTYLMVHPLEDMGIKVLANESVAIHRGKEKLLVSGIDDPHYYYTDQAVTCLEEGYEGFKIVLAHSPELYDVAAENNYSLYLCGHTHGGQICLPGGIPIFTHLHSGRRFYQGLWRHANLIGYTNQGCGVVAIPIRFNTQSEIALLTLKKTAL